MEKQRDDTGKTIPEKTFNIWLVTPTIAILLIGLYFIHTSNLFSEETISLVNKLKYFFSLNILIYLASTSVYSKSSKSHKEIYLNKEVIVQSQLVLIITAIYIFGIM